MCYEDKNYDSSTYPQYFKVCPHFYPQFVKLSINNYHYACLRLSIHLSTPPTTITTSLLIIYIGNSQKN